MNRQPAHHGKYVKLFDWRRRQSGPRLTVSFDKVEEVLGFPAATIKPSTPTKW
jgi:hypothetical protein